MDEKNVTVQNRKGSSTWLWFLGLCLLLYIVALAACGGATPNTAQATLGRWQRVSSLGPGGPYELSADYVEFREDGVMLTLLKDGETFWAIGAAVYTVTNSSQIQVTGSCWQGWESYTCSRTYDIGLTTEDGLIISADNQAQYQRVGELQEDLPPTLMPPYASPTP